ncbi:hypothetical protein [Caldibacillus debilis]|jgi:hypothetical protein|nr:hypothetical protein [Caldibacillus debilis]
MGLSQVELSDLTSEWLAAQHMKQAILYYWERVQTYLSDPPAITDLDLDGLLEGYWFGEHGGLHLYRSEDGWRAIHCQDQADDLVIHEQQLIRRKDFGSRLHVRHYLDFDEDGQAFVKYSRPYRIDKVSDRRQDVR